MVENLRTNYLALRNRSNLCPPWGKFAYEVLSERVGGRKVESFWYEDEQDEAVFGTFVRLVDIPGTLSGDILRLLKDLPSIEGHFEIDGDIIRQIANPPKPPNREDDSEDLTPILARLPEIEIDPSRHFRKKGKYLSEVENLLKCQGGSCPGTPLSPHTIKLLGKSPAGELVFEKLDPRYFALGRFCSIAIYKQWILHIIAALKVLHSLGIVHRDLHIENLLFSTYGQTLVLADLESRWGQRSAPEIVLEDTLDSHWTEKSDIYDIGVVIKCIIYANIPMTAEVEWPVPPPFDRIVEVCMRTDPAQRPELNELEAMVESIST
ncbi:hypothetical protein N7474_001917 [Penicillium riverlandense]|uniref:uncharacterized protein n=1 Tax=Penicillium riverlandense TaxID=1903569 RepID=UPI002546D1F3|nr:uncharacterized protein N7474_001917 [Penicillium riverlandense]KAJ5833606.1 hypothetical protein N7474_001917 [Penicillium riverlandense]